MIQSSTQQMKKCGACEGGYQYAGDYHGRVTSQTICDRCDGRKRVPDVNPKARKFLQRANVSDAQLVGAGVEVVITKNMAWEGFPQRGEADVFIVFADGRKRLLDRYKGKEVRTGDEWGMCARSASNFRYREYMSKDELESAWASLLGIITISDNDKTVAA